MTYISVLRTVGKESVLCKKWPIYNHNHNHSYDQNHYPEKIYHDYNTSARSDHHNRTSTVRHGRHQGDDLDV
nr:hypothetical protein BaRGS_030958 [Batillaria attramentaria]